MPKTRLIRPVVSIQHQLVMDRRTQADSIYHTTTASCGKNQLLVVTHYQKLNKYHLAIYVPLSLPAETARFPSQFRPYLCRLH